MFALAKRCMNENKKQKNSHNCISFSEDINAISLKIGIDDFNCLIYEYREIVCMVELETESKSEQGVQLMKTQTQRVYTCSTSTIRSLKNHRWALLQYLYS